MSDVRNDLAKGLEGKLNPEQLELLLNEVLSITKAAWAEFSCKKCGQRQRQQVHITDARAVTQALTELMNQSWGRPTEQKTETEIIVNRRVFLVRDEEEQSDGDLT